MMPPPPQERETEEKEEEAEPGTRPPTAQALRPLLAPLGAAVAGAPEKWHAWAIKLSAGQDVTCHFPKGPAPPG